MLYIIKLWKTKIFKIVLKKNKLKFKNKKSFFNEIIRMGIIF